MQVQLVYSGNYLAAIIVAGVITAAAVVGVVLWKRKQIVSCLRPKENKNISAE